MSKIADPAGTQQAFRPVPRTGVIYVMTEAAKKFIGQATFAALTGRPVCEKIFDDAHHPLGAHIELARQAKLLCVAPATADFLAKATHGIADDLLSTLYLSFIGKVLFAPAMNNETSTKWSSSSELDRRAKASISFSDSSWLLIEKAVIPTLLGGSKDPMG